MVYTRNSIPYYRFDEPEKILEPFENIPFSSLPLPSKQKGINVKIKSPLGSDDFLFENMVGQESISELFEFHVRLYSSKPDIDFKKILGKNFSLCLTTLKTEKKRYFSGIVTQAQSLPSFIVDAKAKTHVAYYTVTLRPEFWLSTLNKTFRIFMKKKTKDIIETVLKEDKVSFSNKANSAGNTVREYCVQYNESNFDFISRLMEEEGIFYFFEHSESGAKMILADANKSAIDLGSYAMNVVRTNTINCVTTFNSQNQIVAKKFSAIDCDYMKPTTLLKAKGTGKSLGGEVYEYPGNFLESGQASKVGTKRMEEICWPENLAFGESGIIAFSSGNSFKLMKHSRSSLNQKYLLYSVKHFIQQRPENSHQQRQTSKLVYSNSFTALPHDISFMPLRNTPKPKVYGIQTALVVGPDGKEVYSDKEGRVFVEFLWDREGKKDGKNSCPIRCIQGWAGNGFGTAFVPRIGMEVLISFENGDPDRPVIVGCLYNGQNKMPEEVTKEPRIAMLKTKTSPKDGNKANIMSFDDTKDKEKITFNAAKDFELSSIAKENQFLVKQDGEKTKNQVQIKEGLLETIIKKGEKKTNIEEGNYSILLKKGSLTLQLEDGDEVVTLKKGNYILKLDKGEMTVTAKKDITLKTDAALSITAQKDINLTSKANITLKATKNIELKATGGITLTAQKNIQEKATMDIQRDAKAITDKAKMDIKMDGLNISEKAKLNCKREGLNVSDKATLNLKGEGLMVNYEGKVTGTYAGLQATLDGKVMATTKGGAVAALKGGVSMIG